MFLHNLFNHKLIRSMQKMHKIGLKTLVNFDIQGGLKQRIVYSKVDFGVKPILYLKRFYFSYSTIYIQV